MTTRREKLVRFLLARMGRIYVDYGRDPSAAVLLAGKGRSGTTWMADIINYAHDYRLVFEPFHPGKIAMCQHFGKRKYLRPDSTDPRFLRPVEAILQGKIRSAWTDAKNRRFLLANKRLIKTVRANLFLKWLHVNFPEVPIILGIRHPCAVISSAMSRGWRSAIPVLMEQEQLLEDFLQPFVGAIGQARDEFERHVFAWCIEHYVVLHQFQRGEIYLLFYENLCEGAEEEISELFSFLGKPFDRRVMAVLDQPSLTAGHQSRKTIASNQAMSGAWRTRVSPQQARRCAEILGIFGLDQIYTDSPRPNKDGAWAMLGEREYSSK